jgi:aminomethyltransferase
MRRSTLNGLLPVGGAATFQDYWGWEIVLAYGDPRDEYEAVLTRAAVLDASYAGKLRVSGKDRVRYLHNMLSNDIKSLRPGTGCYATLLTHQGRMESDVFVYATAEDLRLECSPAGMPRLLETLSRFVVSDDVVIEDCTDRYALLSVQGPAASALAEDVTGVSAGGLAALEHRRFNEDSLVVRRNRAGCDGFDLWLSPEAAVSVWQRCTADLSIPPLGHLALDWLRTEAGIPWFGVDMDDRRLPMEFGLSSALSYTKGCYRGQEIVARVTHRGNLDRGFGGIALGTADPPRGGSEIRAAGAKVGEITSATFSPALGSVLALGILKQEFLEPGRELEVLDAERTVPGRVVSLPVDRRRK